MEERLHQLPDRRSADVLSLRELLAEDLQTHGHDLTSPGFWALFSHRLGTRGASLSRPAMRNLAARLHTVLATTVNWTWGIRIPLDTRVGRRVRIWHFGSLLLNARSIGDDVHLRHDTTLDSVRRSEARNRDALPVIEDDVDIGSGACIMGAVTVGRGARVGANTVVLESVPRGATVFGVPSRVIGAP